VRGDLDGAEGVFLDADVGAAHRGRMLAHPEGRSTSTPRASARLTFAAAPWYAAPCRDLFGERLERSAGWLVFFSARCLSAEPAAPGTFLRRRPDPPRAREAPPALAVRRLMDRFLTALLCVVSRP